MARVIAWLHLSDLHIEDKPTFDYEAGIVLDALVKDVENLVKKGVRFDFVFVTGDVAFSGKEAEYQLAGSFFDDLLDVTGLTKEQLFLVPGNHDINRDENSLITEALRDSLTTREKVNELLVSTERRTVTRRLADFAEFVSSYLNHLHYDEDLFYVKKVQIDSVRLAIIGLNSAWLCLGGNEDRNRIVVGEKQAIDAMNQASDADARIVLLHHPFEWLIDFDRQDVERALRTECKFILFGHKHIGDFKLEESFVGKAAIVPTGSTFAGRDYFNSYNMVFLDLASWKGDILYRGYSRQRQEWVSATEIMGDRSRFAFDLSTQIYKETSSDLLAIPHIVTGKEVSYKPRTAPKIGYPGLPNYLPRRVRVVTNHGIEDALMGASQDILEILRESNRIALLGGAGFGKTTELRRVARCFSGEDTSLHPYFVPLNRYVNQDISELLDQSWTDIPEKNLLIILDGLDEIESKNRNDAIRRIEWFSDQHPDAKIIVSCRRNFYEVKTEHTTGTLSGFSSLLLLDLNDEEIKRYSETMLDGGAKAFLDAIHQNRIQDLLRIPFYLVRLIELFRNTGSLPKSKAKTFEHLLNARILLDKEHFRTVLELRERQNIIIETLERLALGMNLLGRNHITNMEYQKIIPESSRRDLIKYCTVWWRSEEDMETWQFEHSNFQEYLAARLLARKPLSILKDLISFKPDHKKVIPFWTNTVSFLLSLSDDRELLRWIFDSEPELLIVMEPDRIEKRRRIEIFKGIFNKYKAKQVWIPRDKFGYSYLARFAQSEEIIEFLCREIEAATHYTTICNAIGLLSHLDIRSSKKRQIVSDLLTNCALDREMGEMVQNRALLAIAELQMNSKEVVDKIVPILRSSSSDWVRYGLYYLLHKSEQLDENIDVFLEGIEYVH